MWCFGVLFCLNSEREGERKENCITALKKNELNCDGNYVKICIETSIICKHENNCIGEGGIMDDFLRNL